MNKIPIIIGASVAILGGIWATTAALSSLPTCDGTKVTTNCQKDGQKYSKYIYHAAEPAKTHKVEHPAEYGTRTVTDCIRTDISYKGGSCALSKCRDGSYSGSTGRGTCSYHGGVAFSGGPWYETRQEQYVIKEAWTETVVDSPAKEAYTEKELMQK